MSQLERDGLKPEERLQLIGRLWDSLALEDVGLAPAQENKLANWVQTLNQDSKATII
jgi:hypothetical protein